jgi:hypothetical protein
MAIRDLEHVEAAEAEPANGNGASHGEARSRFNPETLSITTHVRRVVNTGRYESEEFFVGQETRPDPSRKLSENHRLLLRMLEREVDDACERVYRRMEAEAAARNQTNHNKED